MNGKKMLELGAMAAVALAMTEGFATDSGAKADARGTVVGTIAINAGKSAKADRSGAVVYLEGITAAAPTTARHAELRQKDTQFAPALQVVVKGTVMDFPNQDKIFHNVFSVSRPAKF